MPTEVIASVLSMDLDKRLDATEVAQRQLHDGFNELPDVAPPSVFKLFFSQFTSVIVWVLVGAAVVSGLLEDWLDGAAILTIVILNGLLGFVQEFRVGRSMAALRRMSGAMARVIRSGQCLVIEARDLVLGDLILEASLTGESTSVRKECTVDFKAATCWSRIEPTWHSWASLRFLEKLEHWSFPQGSEQNSARLPV